MVMLREVGKPRERPALSEPNIIDCLYVDGAEQRLSDDGSVLISVCWINCPIVDERRVALRVALPRGEAEKCCRSLMTLLGIRGD
jgi:hypothetical protein